MTYESSGSRITEKDLQNCRGGYKFGDIPKDENLYMGVDVGRLLHYVIRTDKKIILMGSVKDFDELCGMVKMYSIKGTVIDALPETREVQSFIKKFPRKVKMCYYTGLAEMKESKKYWNITEDKVNTDRTVSMDMVMAEFKQREIKIPDNYDACIDFAPHLKSTTRIIIEDKKGISKAGYIETGDDHLYHSCNYAKLATNIFNTMTPEIFIINS